MPTNLRARVAVTATLVIAMLALGSATASAHRNEQHTLRLVATETHSEYLDFGASGPSLGDQDVISEVLYQRGDQVGESGIHCTVTAVEPPYESFTFHCVATLSLERGQITLQGLLEIQGQGDPGPFTMAITGGTGRYRNASGDAVVRNVRPRERIYKLRLHSHKKHER